MLNNYSYFLALAEEQNISKAARKLFISHQCLSKYLKNLEESYHITFFDRSPRLTLTPAGQVYLEAIRNVQLLEENLNSQLDDIRQARRGLLRFGTTEGRYRILVPDLLTRFKEEYPDVTLEVQSAFSRQLSQRVLDNELDVVLLNRSDIHYNQLDIRPVLREQMYLVISDPMLERYFPQEYPACRREFAAGVDLARFSHVPFVMSRKDLNSREFLDEYLQERRLQLNCAMELTQLDVHFMMTARDSAASFCWSMYIPAIRQLNQSGCYSHLNVFPIRDNPIQNQLVLVTRKGKLFPAYGKALIQLVRNTCASYAAIDLESL